MVYRTRNCIRFANVLSPRVQRCTTSCATSTWHFQRQALCQSHLHAACFVERQVCFKPNIGNPQGCRALTRRSLDRMCLRAKCTILHQISNDYLDAYVLSESSLFVYPHKVSEHHGGQGALMSYFGAGKTGVALVVASRCYSSRHL